MSVHEVFEATAATYDGARRKLIPCFDRYYAAAVELLPSDAGRVLELGAGTGLFSAMLRARMPEASLHLVDVSEAMLSQARVRLAGDVRVTTEVIDYSVVGLGTGWDVVASALSIHHLEHEAKRELFRRVFAALRPGGVFVNADQVAGSTDALEAQYVQRWLRAVQGCGASEKEVEDSLFRQREDRRASLEAQLVWLREAGFAEVDCWYKDGSFVVFVAVRPETARPDHAFGDGAR